MSLFKNRNKLIKDMKPLDENWVPDKLVNRVDEQKMLAEPLYHALHGLAPPNIMVMGLNGTGKTVTVKHVLNELAKEVEFNYVHTESGTSEYRTATNIAIEMGLNVPKTGLGTLEVWREIKKEVDKHPINIIVIEELDLMLKKGGDEELLYYLSRHPHVCVIGLTVNMNILPFIGNPSVVSSYVYSLKKIVFKPYNFKELTEILIDRIDRSTVEGAINTELDDKGFPFGALQLIVNITLKKTKGDARYAINLLRTALEVAENEDCDELNHEHVLKAEEIIERRYMEESIKELSDNLKLLLLTVLETTGESVKMVYERYNRLAKQYGPENPSIRPLKARRLRDLANELEAHGLIKTVVTGKEGQKGTNWYIEPTISVNEQKKIAETIKNILADNERFWGGS